MFNGAPEHRQFLESRTRLRLQPSYLGVHPTMNAFKIIAAALLFAAVAVTGLAGAGAGTDREHIMSDGTDREHIMSTAREHIL